jgi:hypothetical protein
MMRLFVPLYCLCDKAGSEHLAECVVLLNGVSLATVGRGQILFDAVTRSMGD